MKFRTDIQILRGISIFLVVIFHFFPKYLPNGYLGVDVFFVISGYLITLGIIGSSEKNGFILKNFYIRRIHRILPAALFMLLVVAIIESLILLPSDLINFSRSLLASLYFVSNIFFFLTGGYFGGNDELKPLLHMWSLSIEEQFYIFFPIAFLVLIKLFKRKKIIILIIILVALLSYFLNIYLDSVGGKNASFFLLPTRVWQFLSGTIAAYYVFFYKNKSVSNLYPLVGFGLIFLNTLYIFPLIPSATVITIGVVLILTHPIDIKNNIIINIMIFLGSISFSLYLWHWPIASFLNYYFINAIPVYYSILGIAVSVFISNCSYRFIEERFRKPKNTRRVIFCILFIYILITFGVLIIKKYEGFPSRFNTHIGEIASAVDSNYRCSKTNTFLYGGSKACIEYVDKNLIVNTAVIGNSHAQMYIPAIKEVLNKNLLVVPLNSCTPTLNFNLNSACLKLFKGNFEKILSDNSINTIIIGTTWNNNKYIDKKGSSILINNQKFNYELLNVVNELERSGKNVYLIGPIQTPEKGVNFASVLSRHLTFNSGEDEINEKLKFSIFNNTYIDSIKFFENNLNKKFIKVHPYLCDQDFCYLRREGKTYFADDNHLSLTGSLEVKEAFENIK